MTNRTLAQAERWYEKTSVRLALAIGLNVLFMIFMLSCFELRYEENDDLTVQKFLDGQTAVKTPYCAYLDYILAQLLIWAYDLCGDKLPMFSILQYAMLLFSFSAVTYMLLKKLPLIPALAGMSAVWCFFGADCYLLLTYTKTAGIATVAAVLIMLMALEEREKPSWPGFISGAALLLLACMLRDKEFLACLGLMFPLGLICLIRHVLKSREGRLKRALSFSLPFVAALSVCAGAMGFNALMWQKEPYRSYKEYNDARSRYIDYLPPEYERMPQVYDSLGLDEEDLELGAYYDKEKWTTESYRQLSQAREEHVGHLSLGECLGLFLDSCLPAFFQQRHIFGLGAALLLWTAWGKRDRYSYMALAGSFALFGAMYLLLIWQGRFLVNRTDVGFFFALTVVLLSCLDGNKARKDRALALVLACLCVGLMWRQNRDFSYLYSENFIRDDSAQKTAVEQIVKDEEHIYLTEIGGLDHMLYSPQETVPRGYSDRIVLLGDWCVRHPQIEERLADFGLDQPMRDIVDNERAYLVVRDIEPVLSYIEKYYCPEAKAEPVEPLSSQTGLAVYRVFSH